MVRRNKYTQMHLLPTLYKSNEDSKRAVQLTEDILKTDELKKDDEGFCSIQELCEAIRKQDPSLDYINLTHIVEVFFKTRDRKIIISGTDHIKTKEIRYVSPPKILYFGTTSRVAPRMMHNGIRSKSKGYLKLYDTVEGARNFGKKFLSSLDDEVAVLRINAQAAFTSGMKFSTFLPGEYVVMHIDKRYIEGEEK